MIAWTRIPNEEFSDSKIVLHNAGIQQPVGLGVMNGRCERLAVHLNEAAPESCLTIDIH
jgi:hypothetical protein